MATFLEKKMAAFEAVERARAQVVRRSRIAAILGVALLTAAAVTGLAWLLIPAVLALLLAALWFLVAKNLEGRASTSAPSSDRGRSESRSGEAASEGGSPLHLEPEPAGPVLEDGVELTLDLPRPMTFETSGGGTVTLGAGPREVRFQLSFAPERAAQASDALDYPVCDLELRDDEGGWWRARSYLDPHALTAPLEEGRKGSIHFWRDVPSSWKAALQTSCVIAGVEGLLDSRVREELPIGDGSVTMMFKYQGPVSDVAWLGSESRLVVRTAKMYYEVWKDGERDDIVDGVTFGFLLDPSEVLLPTAPEAHWTRWNAWEEDSEEARPLPVLDEAS